MDTTKKNNKEKDKKVKKSLYILGSLAFTAGAFIAIPKIIDFASSYIYEHQYGLSKTYKVNDDDWGPEIIRKEK